MKGVLSWSVVVVLLIASALVTSVLVSRPLFDETLLPQALDDITIASPDVALSFARYDNGGGRRTLLVTQYRGGRVTGIDVGAVLGRDGADPIALFAQHGYEALRQIAGAEGPRVSVAAAALALPFETVERNIGVGLAYPAHAEEAGLGSEPVLFPKLTQPSGALSTIAKGDAGLLDYEAELCIVALDDLVGPAPAPTHMGLLLCHDVSDRWGLIRGVDPSAPMRTTGFEAGKGRNGFAPIGSLLVIPRDVEAFYRGIELQLYLNGRLRQREHAGAMLWSPQRALGEIFANAGVDYGYGARRVRLLDDPARLPARTIVFTGTPEGVIFKPLNFFNPWLYLQPGDEIVIRADYLGVMRNRIVD
ncbi:MAG: fumarylacetoacetate hydrolase family protein [Pseudomonadota bacterium]|nr:fumarylacetoacetate hydrolase family protein [Pseudomonadota bacterium]